MQESNLAGKKAHISYQSFILSYCQTATKSKPDVFINNTHFLSRNIWLPGGV